MKLRGNIAVVSSVGGVALVDLLVRSVPELLGVGESLVVPVLFLFSVRHVLDLGFVGWTLGWLFLYVVVFQFTPYLYPSRVRDWAAGVPVRFALATSSVLVGVVTESLVIRVLPLLGTTVVPNRWTIFAGVLGMAGLLFVVAAVLPPVGHSLSFFARPTSTLVELPRSVRNTISVTEFIVRSSFVAVLIGVLLAEMSLLYPLPELLAVTIVGYDFVRSALGRVNVLPARSDLAEQVAVGGVAAWGSIRELLQLVYVMGILYTLLGLIFGRVAEIRATVGLTREFSTAAFVVLSIVGVVAYSLKYCTAVLHSLPPLMDPATTGEQQVEDLPPKPLGGLILPALLLAFFVKFPAGEAIGWEHWLTLVTLLVISLTAPIAAASVDWRGLFVPLSTEDYYAGLPLDVALAGAIFFTAVDLLSGNEVFALWYVLPFLTIAYTLLAPSHCAIAVDRLWKLVTGTLADDEGWILATSRVSLSIAGVSILYTHLFTETTLVAGDGPPSWLMALFTMGLPAAAEGVIVVLFSTYAVLGGLKDVAVRPTSRLAEVGYTVGDVLFRFKRWFASRSPITDLRDD
jgi:hypothetical protein